MWTRVRLLGFKFKGQFYFDMSMPMGSSSSYRTDESLSRPVQWICVHKTNITHISHILDDCIFLLRPRPSANSISCVVSSILLSASPIQTTGFYLTAKPGEISVHGWNSWNPLMVTCRSCWLTEFHRMSSISQKMPLALLLGQFSAINGYKIVSQHIG